MKCNNQLFCTITVHHCSRVKVLLSVFKSVLFIYEQIPDKKNNGEYKIFLGMTSEWSPQSLIPKCGEENILMYLNLCKTNVAHSSTYTI